jgi:hypothetical protein
MKNKTNYLNSYSGKKAKGFLLYAKYFLLTLIFMCSFLSKSFSNGTQSQPYVLIPAGNSSFSQFTNSSNEVWFSFTAVNGSNYFELSFVPDTVNFTYTSFLFYQNGSNLDTTTRTLIPTGLVFYPLINSIAGQVFKVKIVKSLKSGCQNCNVNGNLTYNAKVNSEPELNCPTHCGDAYSLNRNNLVYNPSYEMEPNYMPIAGTTNGYSNCSSGIPDLSVANLTRANNQFWFSTNRIRTTTSGGNNYQYFEATTPDILRVNYQNMQDCTPSGVYNLTNISSVHGNFVLGCALTGNSNTPLNNIYMEKAVTPICNELIGNKTYEVIFRVRKNSVHQTPTNSKVGFKLLYWPNGSTTPINSIISELITATNETNISGSGWQTLKYDVQPGTSGKYVLVLGFFSNTQSHTYDYVYFDGVEVREKVTPTISASALKFCGDPITLTASLPSGGSNFYWSANGQTISTNPIITVTPTTTTTYTANYTGAYSFCSNYETVTVTYLSNYAISINSPEPFVCSGQNTILTCTGAPAGTTYAWTFDGNPVGANSSVYGTTLGAGIYACTATYGSSPNQCIRNISTNLATDLYYCCDKGTTYNKNDFTASGSITTQTWTPTSNPLNNNGGTMASIKGTITIPAGYDITISGMNLSFGPNGRIVVQNSINSLLGGRLTIDNTRLRGEGTKCEMSNMWNGIEVKGNASTPQLGKTSSKQGWLTIQNGSIIEDAWFGVNISKNLNTGAGINEEYYSWEYSDNPVGGVVEASNCFFYNNRKDLHMGPFENKTPGGTVVNNMSRFTNVVFSTTAALYLKSNNPYGQGTTHANLSGVRGIQFNGCDFTNTYYASLPMDKRGTGIKANNSIFSINNNGSTDIAQFQNLNYGISSFTSGSTLYPFTARKCNFNNNKIATKAENISNLAFVQNTVGVFNETDLNPANSAIGLSLIGCTGYAVDENTFTNASGTGIYNTYGILVDNSGNADNQIYNNSFSNLKRGIQSQFINGFINSSSTGLRLLCNKYQSNLITEYSQYNSTTSSTLAKDQGTTSNPAGNSFFNINTTNSSFSDFKNNNPNIINYFKHPDADRSIQNPLNVLEIPTSIAYTTSSCPSNFSGGGLRKLNDNAQLLVIESFNTSPKNLVKGNTTEQRNLSPEQINRNIERGRLLNNIVRAYLLGDVQNANDSVLAIYAARPDLFSPEALADAYLASGDTTEAESNLDNASIDADEQNMYSLLISLQSDTFNLSDSVFINQLNTLLSSDNYGVMRQANLLIQVASGNDLFPYLGENLNERLSKSELNLSEINENKIQTKLRLYPNPVKDILTLEGASGTYKVYSLNGQIILSGYIENSQKLDTSKLHNGTYLLKFEEENGQTSFYKFNVLH